MPDAIARIKLPGSGKLIMESKLLRPRSYSSRPALLIALAPLLAGCGREDQAPKQAALSQAPASQPSQPPAPSAAAPQAPAVPPGVALPTLSPLESLVAPIALYPDPLLAELLVASTYPLEVVQAARWLDAKPDLGTLKSKDWDASILRLAEVPSVLKMMSDHLDWTTQLGDAFLAKPEEVMDTVQSLRRRASEAGFLKDTPEQKVSRQTVAVAVPQPAEPTDGGGAITAQPAVVQKEIVRIEPAKPDTVYVPQYSPQAAYSATPAPPPASPTGSSYAYPAPAPAYYPSYSPATATTATNSSSDQLLTFGAGALVGGLMTWGIMEWADDDWDDHYHGGYYGGGHYPPVSHYYGNTVCRSGNCWHGGGYGGGYNTANVDRGNVNISGNEINVDRNGYFKADQLTAMKNRERWQPEARHRRGQPYPAAAEDRLGRIASPALAGDRLGAAQTLPATARGFDGGAARRLETPRPTAGEVRQRLGQETKAQGKFGGGGQVANRPVSTDVRQRLEQGNRANALEGVRDGNQNIQREAGRGAASRQQAQLAARDKVAAVPRDTGVKPKPERARRQELGPTPRAQEFKATPPQSAKRSPPGGGRDLQPVRDNQRRVETARPNAFENAADRGGTQAFSKRGAASRQTMAAARPAASGGAGFQGGRSGAGQFQGGGGGRRGRR